MNICEIVLLLWENAWRNVDHKGAADKTCMYYGAQVPNTWLLGLITFDEIVN